MTHWNHILTTKKRAKYIASSLKRGGWTGVRIIGTKGSYIVKYNK